MWWKQKVVGRFKGPQRGHAARLRPKQIMVWVRGARKGGPEPPVLDVYTFGVQWWAWWVEINPDWHEWKGARLGTEGSGGWEKLAISGPNGLLNILICLQWWRDAMPAGGDIGGWQEAVDDVHWALSSMG
ncbi:hypothetical protein C8J57DRAFT_1095045 [Mycena rebaudengoi]|nr:hypothetical protein C8J57DRAFT_1095045 [Mycena rebaudengoi]